MAQGNGGIIGPPNTVTQVYKDKLTVFTANGCFTKASCNPSAPGTGIVMVVAGGGGSGNDGGGGGGAGGLVLKTCQPLPGSAVPVTVGGGGAGSNVHNTPGVNGSNSIFATACNPITATGGGYGGGEGTPSVQGAAGGSRGG